LRHDVFDALHRIETKLDRLIAAFERKREEDYEMSAALDKAYQDLATQIAANTSAESSAVDCITALVNRLQATLNTNTDDSTKVAQLQQEISAMKASQTALGAAILSGTAPPAAPPAPPVSSGGSAPPTSGTVVSGGTSSSTTSSTTS
jgi:hypothetical protein